MYSVRLALPFKITVAFAFTVPAARRAIETEWRYATDPHLPPRAAPDFRSREDPEEQIWTYSFKDNTGRVLTRTGTETDRSGLAEVGEERWCDAKGIGHFVKRWLLEYLRLQWSSFIT